MDGRQIGSLDSTIVPWMVDKSAELIVHARHEWPISWPREFKPWKYENLCLSILGLVHKSRNLISWFYALNILYILLPCKVL